MKLGCKSLSQSEQEEAGLDLVRPWDSFLQMLSITASRDNWTTLFSRRAAHLTVHEEGGARGLKGFGHFYEGGTWWEAGMPEIETNLVKTQQGLPSGGQGPFHLPDLLLPHCYLMWSTGQQEAKAKSKSTEGNPNGATARFPAHCWQTAKCTKAWELSNTECRTHKVTRFSRFRYTLRPESW